MSHQPHPPSGHTRPASADLCDCSHTLKCFVSTNSSAPRDPKALHRFILLSPRYSIILHLQIQVGILAWLGVVDGPSGLLEPIIFQIPHLTEMPSPREPRRKELLGLLGRPSRGAAKPRRGRNSGARGARKFGGVTKSLEQLSRVWAGRKTCK